MQHTDPNQDPNQNQPPAPEVPAANNGHGVDAGNSGAADSDDYGADKI